MAMVKYTTVDLMIDDGWIRKEPMDVDDGLCECEHVEDVNIFDISRGSVTMIQDVR
jgi:hypothetical protein